MTAASKTNAIGWAGWQTIDTIFAFGDSYTTTGFDVHGTQPQDSNPMGNPDFYGSTSSNGPNWAVFLSTKYNARFVKLYNLAYRGATVASSLIHQHHPEYLSLEQQVLDSFIPNYAPLRKSIKALQDPWSDSSNPREPSEQAPWSSESTLFALFFGINDVGLCYADNDESIYDEYLRLYRQMIMELYKSGARNLLFINVPPVNRSPLTTEQGAKMMAKEAEHIRYWNNGLVDLVSALRESCPDMTAFHYDAHKAFSRALDHPESFPETSIYKDTTTWSPAYQGGTLEMDTRLPGVPFAVNEYFWLDSLHPTYPIHDLCARQIVHLLSNSAVI